MSNKFSSILRKLPQLATRSDCNHQHGAVVVKNGTPIAWGFNSIKGGRTYHAEHDVLRKYLALKGFKGWQRSQCILWR